LPGCEATIDGIGVVWDMDFLRWLATQDADLREDLGFIVSYKLGIAATGFHDGDEAQKAIHAFRKGDWDQFFDQSVPFNVTG